ncbi:MAG: 8-oxoguanine DNA glycosylase, N-terminal domain-containing protein, partial [Candidatus Omnitrophica bacterium]|nr:8-oxoguanine DNA glycosylase, N-terminal domain-containing protein [Candidatus Omnitrophota bacterium]
MKSFSIFAFDFDLASTLECGQVFRWDKVGSNEYLGVIGHSIVRIRQEKSRLYVESSNRCITPAFINSYFDLTLDLPYIYNTIRKDKHIKSAIERCYGLRIIRQPLWECVASFIISTRNNIPRIKKIIDKLSRCFV